MRYKNVTIHYSFQFKFSVNCDDKGIMDKEQYRELKQGFEDSLRKDRRISGLRRMKEIRQ